MSYKRTPVESLDIKVNSGQKKYVRYKEGADLYSLGIHGFQRLAKEAGAVRKINGVCLVNVEVLNEYIEEMYG
ncbi:MAG: hypothetical protein K6E33_01880 [Lachnospiraceae bacterium]|nr:hypothetical protein [Lachnospiraceae bacterium]